MSRTIRLSLAAANALPRDAFVQAFGGVFEHSPWVARQVAHLRPFDGVDALHAAMCDAVARADAHTQLALIRAHPELAGRVAIGDLTAASQREQRGAGLDQCTPDEFARLTALNDAYSQRFGFPFIIAVRDHTRDSIIAEMMRRLTHTRDAEIAEALRQIARIAGFRLADMIAVD
jgi:2-oxo-4-hydroxy-4-carboxy-5-ureidoimidazoline decarboxylase